MKKSKGFSYFLVIVLSISIYLLGCASSSTPTVRSYNGTASVGDFVTISIDSSAKTITYDNVTNGETGTATYDVNSDGSYSITDPNNNLLLAYEVPGYVMVIKAQNAGANRDTTALITAIESVPFSFNNFKGRTYNYMEFRTNNGGVEIGAGGVDNSGNMSSSSYDPGAIMWTPPTFFGSGTVPAGNVQEGPSGRFFTLTDPVKNESMTVFGTQNGLFAIDGSGGAVLGIPQAATKYFDPVNSGTYNAIFYEKTDAQMQSGVETGTPSEGKASITISAGGVVTITDSNGTTLASGTLAAIADTPAIYDGTANTMTDPCHGVFTFETKGSVLQDVFVSFVGNAVIFSSFQTAWPVQNNGTYTYFYGVGLK